VAGGELPPSLVGLPGAAAAAGCSIDASYLLRSRSRVACSPPPFDPRVDLRRSHLVACRFWRTRLIDCGAAGTVSSPNAAARGGRERSPRVGRGIRMRGDASPPLTRPRRGLAASPVADNALDRTVVSFGPYEMGNSGQVLGQWGMEQGLRL
jgi:hypothetical protein